MDYSGLIYIFLDNAMLILMYCFACQRILSFTYLEYVPVFFKMVDLKVFEMQILRSHPRPTECRRWGPTASSPSDSDVWENLRTTTVVTRTKRVCLPDRKSKKRYRQVFHGVASHRDELILSKTWPPGSLRSTDYVGKISRHGN